MTGNIVLITGASGFVGRHLLAHLKKCGQLARAIYRSQPLETACDDFYILPQVDKQTDWADALTGVDVVIHLAARVHVMKDTAVDPLHEFLEVNVHASLNLAKQAAIAGVKRFIYVSSIKVNGEYTESKPYSELDLPNPQDPYGISKWQAEQSLMQLCAELDMELVIVRPPLVYGPGVKANFLNLIKIIDRRIPLPLGSIRNQRSLLYVGNLVDALILCATHPQAAGETFILSDGEDVSTPQLINKLAGCLHRKFALYRFPLGWMRFLTSLIGKTAAFQRLTSSLQVDSSKIRHMLNWRPPYSLDQGLKLTVEAYLKAKGQ